MFKKEILKIEIVKLLYIYHVTLHLSDFKVVSKYYM